MAILNYRIQEFSGKRVDKQVKSIEVNANSRIISVSKEKDKRVGQYLHVNFEYDVKYEPGVGELRIAGTLWYTHDKLDDVVKIEKHKVELKKEVVTEISTAIVRESLLEALDFTRKLQLPPPMQLPTVNVKPEKLSFTKAS